MRPSLQRRLASFILSLLALGFGVGCGNPVDPGETNADYRVGYDPYAEVDWDSDLRCLTQFHDHVENASRFVRFLNPYEAAGYHAVAPLHYSGVPTRPEVWTRRYWPISDSIPSVSDDAELLDRYDSLRLLIPGGEEVGNHHVLSLFLVEYIEKWDGRTPSKKYPWQYESTQDCIDRIRKGGGLAVIAHPWEPIEHYDRLNGFQAIEVFSGYSHRMHAIGERGDDNARFLELWDHLLATKSTRIWGIGVNDWFGPGREDLLATHPAHVDAGKTILFIKDWSLESLRDAFERGAMIAIRDVGERKGDYPRIDRIEASPERIALRSDGEVLWMANRETIAVGESLSLSGLPRGLRYIRAEIHNASGTVFAQPFALEELTP